MILYYDYALVFSNEVKYFWPPKNRITRPSALYLITRFLSIFGHIPSFIASFATGSIKVRLIACHVIRFSFFLLGVDTHLCLSSEQMRHHTVIPHPRYYHCPAPYRHPMSPSCIGPLLAQLHRRLLARNPQDSIICSCMRESPLSLRLSQP